jgi:phosphoglucosamine mutase
MHQIGANLGGEESGHMVLSDYSLTGDAMLTAIVVCLGIKELGKKTSEIFPIFEPFPTIAHNLRFTDKAEVEKIMTDKRVQQIIAQAQKKLADIGSLIVRKSGTEPVIRLKLEAKDENLIANLSNEILQAIQNAK